MFNMFALPLRTVEFLKHKQDTYSVLSNKESTELFRLLGHYVA